MFVHVRMICSKADGTFVSLMKGCSVNAFGAPWSYVSLCILKFCKIYRFFLGGTGFTYEEGWRFFCLFVFLLFDLYTNCTILRLSMYICQSKTKRQAWSFSWWITISQVAHLNLYVLLNKSIGKWTCPKMIHHSWYISGPAGYPFVIWSPSFFPAEPNCNR